MPPGSRRAVTTPESAVEVSRSDRSCSRGRGDEVADGDVQAMCV